MPCRIHCQLDKLLIILADGELTWDMRGNCFDPSGSDALPKQLWSERCQTLISD